MAPAADVVRQDVVERPDSHALAAFVAFQIVCQLILISPIEGGRTIVRAAALGAGLAMLLVPSNARRFPAHGWALAIVFVLVAAIAHPLSDLPLAAPAQAALYVAVLSPLFWTPRLAVGRKSIERVFQVLWVFHMVSTAVGILQVLIPGALQPRLSPVVISLGAGYVSQLKITVAGGVKVFRPMGLTDIPGGAGASASYAVLFGVGFFLTTKRNWVVALSIASMLGGITCLYLSQIRSLVVMTAISVFALATVLVLRRDFRRLATISVTMVVLAALGFRSALSLAHEAVSTRLGSLTVSAPQTVYYNNRGRALDYTINELAPKYPLGAGIGRWGMMKGYFGRSADALWAELQWTGWLLDGGIPLILVYVFALGVLLRTNWLLSRAPPLDAADTLPVWGAVLLGHSVGILALTFSYPVFLSQTGMEFWLLSAGLWTAVQVERERAASREVVAA